jgi:hypothetical protein
MEKHELELVTSTCTISCNVLLQDCTRHSYVRMQHFVRRSTFVPFRRFWGDVRRELMQRLSAALHGTLGSYLRDAFREGNADAVACLPVPRAMVFPSFLLFAWGLMLLFLLKKCLAYFTT